uniref:Uncharacterized protein n=1 Tax=Ditylenchus dipsaci TaxID=166011 RepID=A0A915EDE2_9BILA
MYHGLLHVFVELSERLSHLQALELDLYDTNLDNWTDELFEVIARKCPNLEHFGLREFHYNLMSEEKLAVLASLPKLCSVHIHSHNIRPFISIPIFTLFRELSRSGRLQYFHTNQVLSIEDVCEALVLCRDLTGIFCGQPGEEDQQEDDFDRFLATLDKIHEGEQPPATAGEERILHTNFGNRSEKNLPRHPWARFYAAGEQVPSNKIGERICFGGVSSKPRSAQFW